jgi:hypothetical protein
MISNPMSDDAKSGRYDPAWKVGPGSEDVTIGFQLVADVRKVAAEQLPHLADLFPFRNTWASRMLKGEGWLAVDITEQYGGSVPTCGGKLDEILPASVSDLIGRSSLPSYEEIKAILDCSFSRFGYIGPYRDHQISYPHLIDVLNAWLSVEVVPTVNSRNRDRVLAAVPAPPSYRPQEILSNVYVLESDDAQGTCFHLRGVGLITCQHVLDAGMAVFDRDLVSERHPIKIVKSHKAIDLAVIEAPGFALRDGLQVGRSNDVRQMDHVLLAGFPRYRLGDTGIVSPGLVTGFRPVSTIRRLLVNAGIVQGNSGGPVLNGKGEVIGVAVTGADRPENIEVTENHGVIPIEALDLF